MVRRLVLVGIALGLSLGVEPATAQSRGGGFILWEDDFPLAEPATPPPPPPLPPAPRKPPPEPQVWRTLAPFENLQEFNEFRARARDISRAWNHRWGFLKQRANEGPLLAQEEVQDCDPAAEECVVAADEVSVTGMRASVQQSITNNQEAGVDEGDIVKAYDRFLVVLMHGRLMSLDTGGGAGQLRLIDRIDAYHKADEESWIDEVLIFKDTLLVTGYSYETDSSNIGVYRIDERGKFSFLARYSIESEDYYSWENYASRIVDGKLVIYTPFDLSEYDTNEDLPLPRIRRFTEAGGASEWRPLFSVTDVYRPIQPAIDPAMHVISVCPIDPRAELRCEARGIVGPWQHEMYVAPDHTYLWLTGDGDVERERLDEEECVVGESLFQLPGQPSAVYRMTLANGSIGAVHTEGWPRDQFSLEEKPSHLWALVRRSPLACDAVDHQGQEFFPMALMKIPQAVFSTRPIRMRAGDFHEVPPMRDHWGQQTRFSERHLLYGQSRQYTDDDRQLPDELYVVSLAMPDRVTRIVMPHDVQRLELFGVHAVTFGHLQNSDFAVSSVRLNSRPHLVDSQVMPGASESEGRSHAFNSFMNEDGSGIFGLPTMDESDHAYLSWDEIPTHVRFFTATRNLELDDANRLSSSPVQQGEATHYKCEVSCYDWYGNSRPIFFRDRIFALIGHEMIEGELRDGRVSETLRVNLTGAPLIQR